MKKIVFPLYSIIAFAVVFLLSCFVFIADTLADKNIHFYTGLPKFTIGDVLIAMFFVGGGLFVSAIAVFLHKNLKKRFLKIVIALVAAFVVLWLLICVMISCTLFMPYSYVEVTSDNGEHCIVIGEDSRFFSPYGGDIYEKTSFCTVKRIGEYDAGTDFYTPFSDGNYYVVWNEKDFELHYDFDGKEEEYTVIAVKYAE